MFPLTRIGGINVKILEHRTGDISGTLPVLRKFGVSDTFLAHRTAGIYIL